MGKTILVLVMILIQIIAVIPAAPDVSHLDASKEYFYSDVSNGDGNQNKWAIFITAGGGPTYEHHEKRDRNDVKDLKSALINHGWQEDHILTLLEEEATENAILNESFEWLNGKGEEEDDLVFIYFSMHGTNHTIDEAPLDEPDGKDEIIFPWDKEYGGWNLDKFIVDDMLAEKFDLLHSQNIVIVFHTCHAGGMIDGASDFAKSGRVVLTSCDVNEGSIMLFLIKHWLFPYYLIHGLDGNADKNKDHWVSAEELFYYTEFPVALHSAFLYFLVSARIVPQHPQLYDGWPSEENNGAELNLINLERL